MALLSKQIATLLLKSSDFLKNRLDILTLLFKGTSALFQHFDEPLKLCLVAFGGVIHINQLADFRERQTEPFAAQCELEPNTITICVYAASAGPLRGQQSLIFVKADCPGR